MDVIPLVRRILAICVVTLSLMTIPGAANARATNGHDGIAMPRSDQTCLGYSWGGFVNNCSYAVGVMYPMMHSGGGFYGAYVWGRAFPPALPAGCAMVSTDANITTYVTSGWYYFPTDNGSVRQIGFNLYGIVNGTEYIQCSLSQSTYLYGMNYDQADD
jgi:hypothetical protein